MEKVDFLAKLHREGNLQLVGPSEEIKESYSKKSQSSLKSDNSKIKKTKEERIEKQYYVDFEVAEKDVASLLEMAKEFNSEIYDFMQKLTSKQISEYPEKLRKILGN